MAGYNRYYGEVLISRYSPILKRIPYRLAKRFFKTNETYQRGIYSSQFEDELDRFLAIYTIFSDELKSTIYKREISASATRNIKPFFGRFYKEFKSNGDSLNHLLYLDTRTMLPDNLLLFNDKITMAHSIENRVPFLDKNLVAFVESLPSHFKLNGKVHKYLEKKAARKWLPVELINRKKRAFETPVVDWFKEDLFDELVELFNQQDSLSRQYFERKALIKMLELHRQGKRNFGKQIFILFALELWYQNFYLQF
jgi:asparagine synthase (glutamine-hydrolysing)